MTPLRLAALMSLLPGVALAADFSCRNEQAEIVCDRTACAVTPKGEFTPMQLSRQGGQLAICAYSGCWSGPFEFWRARDDVDFFHARVRRHDGATGLPADIQSLAVIHDRRAGTAQIRFLGFSHPMSCG